MSNDCRISLSIVVMAYNEEANIGSTLDMVHDWASNNRKLSQFEVIVVDDGSTDNTASRCEEAIKDRPYIRLVKHERNRGMGAAIRTGYKSARYEFVTQLPADGQVLPTVLDLFLEHVPEKDIVLSVYDKRGDGPLREFLSFGYKSAAFVILGRRGDYTGTMVFRRSLLDSIYIYSDSFVANLEFPLKALSRGASSAVVTFRASPRLSGESKVVGVKRIARVFGELMALRLRGVD